MISAGNRTRAGFAASIAALAVLMGILSAAPSPPVVTASAAQAAPSPRASTPRAAAPVTEAPDAAAAVVAAHRQGTRVEVASKRTETRSVYVNPDGTMAADLAAVPVRVKDGNRWKPIDTTLESRPDGSIRSRATTAGVTFSGGGPSAPLVRSVRDGKALELFWPAALPRPKVHGNVATYPDVLPGVDLVMRAERDGYQQHLMVKTARAARNPALARIVLRVGTEGVRLDADGAGALRAVDAAGKPVFTAPPSVMWDASGSRRTAHVGVFVDSGTLTLVPDQGLLTDPATVYPVTIDPREAAPGPWGWSNPNSGLPGDAFWDSSPDPAHPGWAQVGQCWNARGECGRVREAWAYFQFDTGFIGGADVLWAFLDTEVMHSPNCNSYTHQLYLAAWGIDATTTWNNRPQGALLDERAAPPACGGTSPVSFTVGQNIMHSGFSTYFLKAQDSGLQEAWRKYDPAQTHLHVRFNNKPNPPYDVRTDPALTPCRWCAGEPYTGIDNIRLIATLSDPDNDLVRPQWRVTTNGVLAAWDGPQQISGATHDTNIDLTSKDGAEVTWWVHASDDIASSPPTAGPTPFRVERSPVTVAPSVTSAQYPSDNGWHGAASVPGIFTFGASGVGNINNYLYGWNDPPSTWIDADALGGGASVTLTPPRDGPQTLYVQSMDRAGHHSPTQAYRFNVRAGTGPYAQWSFEGSTKDTAFLGGRDGTLNGSATYGPGAVGTALYTNDSGTMTAPNTLRTDASFSVAAWVKADRLVTGGASMDAVSQDGSVNSGFYLEYSSIVNKWVFVKLSSDDTSPNLGWFAAQASQTPQANQWVHLAGTFDATTRTMSIFVNGELGGSATLPLAPWHAAGPVAIGRGKYRGNSADYWPGAIDEVQLYDRVLSADEVRTMVARDNVQAGYWKFDDRDGATAANSVAGGEAAVLSGGAAFIDGGAVGRAVHFDGMTGQATTTGPAVQTDASFSVAAWVKADRLVTGGASMDAVSQDGSVNSGFYLEYSSIVNKWVFVKLSSDDTSPNLGWFAAQASQTPQANQWVHLAGTFDATTRTMTIYVNGELGGSATLPVAPWNAAGPFAIGRGKFKGNLADWWPGAVDEVRLYSRALDPTEIRGIMSQSNVTAGTWKLDGNANDSSGVPHHGVLGGNPTWVAGHSLRLNPADKAIHLDGANDYVHAPSAIDTAQSFAVSAWVRPEKPGTWSAVLSQDGVHTSGLAVRAGADGHWWLGAAATDTVDATVDWAIGQNVQYGVWTHLAGVYSKERKTIELYVNGVLVASAPHTAGFTASGELQMGRLKWNDGYTNYLAGAIDDVSVYGRPLFADEVQALAGRDLSLVHSWQLDEASGSTSADSIGGRGLTLTGGATFAPGRVGNAVKLDGATGFASSSGIDLRTDQSFTVSAWVNADAPPCAGPVCKADAVTAEGGQTSKFRLGWMQDNDQNVRGKWQFEMPRPDGTVQVAALTVLPGEVGKWVHLVGVYDAPARTLWLYVNGVRIANGALDTPWQAGGGLAIGRGTVNGGPADYWKGSVDEVRLYTGALDANRVKAMYDSYPAA